MFPDLARNMPPRHENPFEAAGASPSGRDEEQRLHTGLQGSPQEAPGASQSQATGTNLLPL